MRAALIQKHGKLDGIKIGELDAPEPGPNEVLIETKHAALNHLDIFVVRGWPGLNLALPHVIGADGSGIVKEIGAGVSTVFKGDRVTINPGISCNKCIHCLSGNQVLCRNFSILGEFQWGTFAEFIAIPEVNVMKVPQHVPLNIAAAAPLTFLTAYRMLTTQGNLKNGDIVFVHGAGGGVSSAAVQIAKHFGATVIATTSTPEKIEKTKELGADYVIDYKEEKDFTKKVFVEMTNRKGVDIVIDNVGQATFPTSIKLLRPGGRLVTCGVTSGPFTKFDITSLFWKHLEIKGSTMGNQKDFREVMELILKGKIKPVIDREFPLEQAREAEEYLEQGNQFGKVILNL